MKTGTFTLRRRRYPTLIRKHECPVALETAAASALRAYFVADPAARASETAEHGIDPLRDSGCYMAAEAAEGYHPSIAGKTLLTASDVAAWEAEENYEPVEKAENAATVYELLKPNYPAATIAWVKAANWRRQKVKLADIKMGRRPGGRDPGKVQGIRSAIEAGKTMDPVVLVSTLDGFEIADGYHRTLAARHAGRDAIDAWVGSGTADSGPWMRAMHDQKINKDDPGAGDVHIDNASGEIGEPETGQRKKKREISIVKTDDEQRLVYGIVLEPNVEDSQGDVVSKEDVELAAHRYLYTRAPIGDQHGQMAPDNVRPVESYIAPCDFELGGQTVRKGSWVLVGHVPDDRLWEQVKKGQKGAWSVAGTGKRTPI